MKACERTVQRRESLMPQIIVTADTAHGNDDGAVMLRERVTVADFESNHFAARLVERLGWAVGDADQVERESDPGADRADRADHEARRDRGASRPDGATTRSDEAAAARQMVPTAGSS
jgi:hypothetical protein